ncbi:vacuolar cation/proton exchanger [Rhynchospora pubera]|uniref:Vacuolar cation/proton exchanger n=1 Tax=Rhynchospora pubera TaxID=906938 RepID=A0AAV8HLL8_9POAL|nr:vacuolar cation/proton exchanger [Rhynchospora pubera]
MESNIMSQPSQDQGIPSRRRCYRFSSQRIWRSIKAVIFSSKINVLIPFGPVAIVVHYVHNHGSVFFLSLLGIIPLAERLGFATEQLSLFTGPTVGALLNASFGNATELIISIQAMRNGMLRIVQQSLLGSVLSNMLLVLGCALFAGGIRHKNKVQIFNERDAGLNSGMLMVALMGMLSPTVLHYTNTEIQSGKSELVLSRFTSCLLLLAYAAYLFYQIKYQPTDPSSNQEEIQNEEKEEAVLVSKWECITWLVVFTVSISVLSDYLVDAIEGASRSWNIPIAFISVVLLPIVGNAAEHASAIMFAINDKLDISLGVALGSATQISMFLIPLCVLIGWVMGKTMDLNFKLFETAVLFLTVVLVAFMLQDGTSNYLKGFLLIICYFVVAASFYVHVDATSADNKLPQG